MSKVKSTHKWSSIFMIVKLSSNILLGVIMIFVVNSPVQSFISRQDFISSAYRDIVTIFVFLIFILLVTLLHIFLLNKFYDSLSTMFYIKNELDTLVSLREANYLKKLFEPSYLKENKWISMQHIKDLPAELRRKTIIDTAKKIYDKKLSIKKVGVNISNDKR